MEGNRILYIQNIAENFVYSLKRYTSIVSKERKLIWCSLTESHVKSVIANPAFYII